MGKGRVIKGESGRGQIMWHLLHFIPNVMAITGEFEQESHSSGCF